MYSNIKSRFYFCDLKLLNRKKNIKISSLYFIIYYSKFFIFQFEFYRLFLRSRFFIFIDISYEKTLEFLLLKLNNSIFYVDCSKNILISVCIILYWKRNL